MATCHPSLTRLCRNSSHFQELPGPEYFQESTKPSEIAGQLCFSTLAPVRARFTLSRLSWASSSSLLGKRAFLFRKEKIQLTIQQSWQVIELVRSSSAPTHLTQKIKIANQKIKFSHPVQFPRGVPSKSKSNAVWPLCVLLRIILYFSFGLFSFFTCRSDMCCHKAWQQHLKGCQFDTVKPILCK